MTDGAGGEKKDDDEEQGKEVWPGSPACGEGHGGRRRRQQLRCARGRADPGRRWCRSEQG
ncbi:hypothetical protein E2562_039293 [Oryza meyeriana var. granulata]|uniref:Uncharacterized protein n=1 Tax=Oryza meyeriana var. granulata TaxID=110450 RepID=A0A6G1E8T6_9ORYZ|nr:hypothetical protein E2562_039293 [Oryza meyeriana var. granulata]